VIKIGRRNEAHSVSSYRRAQAASDLLGSRTATMDSKRTFEVSSGSSVDATNQRRLDLASTHKEGGRGFAGMDPKKQRAIASKGGASVPDEERSFSKDRELASDAGRKGGASVPDEERSFSKDRELASEAGRKGGASVPDEERSFSKDRELASDAGRKGGASVPDEERSFSKDRKLASEAGRKGGKATHSKH
jgi:uncharacterized protein